MKLYTLCGASRDTRFSPHAWKTVMALHHKGLAFEETPTPFTAIPALENGFSPTVPVLKDGARLVRDSFDIAVYLDETYPDRPSLFGGGAGVALTRALEGYSQFVIHPALTRIMLTDIHDCLAPEDQAYFRTSRESRLGRTLEQVAAAREGEIETFPAKLEPVRHALKYQTWLGGDRPLFVDYIVFGALQWARVVSPVSLLKTDDPVAMWFERCLDLHGGAGREVAAAE
ncbi:glutathione S-transferase family protein [Rhizobium sp. TRM95796]|uniref:glutathione S-transferase family protein n=1 Tax=Rhizobium sp. TRM95796 TaxID=2979862 RepID=UPI0021E90936|nr:glutathione S-transferase family protein [Rhizobium sp. TRM95796]MCV3765427.1 glutathione S-transferase family protein [Rhizobium sp. TRM95796]